MLRDACEIGPPDQPPPNLPTSPLPTSPTRGRSLTRDSMLLSISPHPTSPDQPPPDLPHSGEEFEKGSDIFALTIFPQLAPSRLSLISPLPTSHDQPPPNLPHSGEGFDTGHDIIAVTFFSYAWEGFDKGWEGAD